MGGRQAEGTILNGTIGEDLRRKVMFEERPEENGVSDLVTCKSIWGAHRTKGHIGNCRDAPRAKDHMGSWRSLWHFNG